MKKQVLSILLALCMVLSLMPVAALATEQKPTCGKIEHSHTSVCYESRLICNLEESEEHTHTTSCSQDVLTCKLEEHTHDESCYTVQKPTEQTELSAYEKVVELFLALPSADSITAETTDEEKAKIMVQGQAAMDAYDALTEDERALFDKEQTVLLVAALALNDALTGNTMNTLNASPVEQKPTCGKIEHSHTSVCYESRLICNLKESEEHTHTTSCSQDVLTCKLEEHTHDESCYTVQKPTEQTELSAYEKVVELFLALPSADSITAETTDEEKAKIMVQGQAAMDAYDALTEDERALFDKEQTVLLVAALALNDALTGNTMNTLDASSVMLYASSVTLYVSSAAADDTAARIDGAKYKTLQGAINKAVSGDTIILSTDINESSVLITDIELTIDFNGHVLTLSSTSYGIDVYGTAKLTLKDSSGNNSGGVKESATQVECILLEDSATVTIESGSYVSNYGYCVEVKSGSTGQVIINGGSVTAVSSCVYNDSSKARIFLNGGTFSGNINGANGGVLLTPEVLKQVYGINRLYNNIYIHLPSGSNKLTEDLDLHDWQLRILEGEKTTIDLNGFNITGNGMMKAPTEGGTVIIGDINNLSCLIQVHETGKLTFKNTGTCDGSHGRIHNDATPLIYIIKNYGQLTLAGNLRIDARLTCSGPYTQSGAVFMYSTFNSSDAVATLTVNNGVKITAKKADAATTYFTNGILAASASNGNGVYADRIKITINGGTIYGDYYAMSLAGTLTINGGTFKNSDTATSEVFYIGYPVADLTGISNASFIGKNIAMYIGNQAFQSDTITIHNTTINQTEASAIATAIAQEGETKNVIITGKDTYWVANALTYTNAYCKGTIQIRSGIFSADPTSYVPATSGVKDYAVLNYTNAPVSDYYLVAPWTRVGADNTVSLYYPASAAVTDTASDDVSIVALNDTESIIPDATRVQTRHFTLSSDANIFTAINGLSVTAFTNGNRLTVQKTKACNATEAYVWYGEKNVGRIIIETKNAPTYDVGGEITGAIGRPTAYLIRDGVKYYATVTGNNNPYEYVVAGVPAGIYDLVVSSATTQSQPANIITTTVLVEIINHSIAQNVVLPQSVYNSVVTTEGKKTPNVEAGGLDDMAKTVGALGSNTYVLIELKVVENESSGNADDVRAAITGDGMIKGIIMDTDVLNTVNNKAPVKITEIDQRNHGVSLITVVFHLPDNLQGKDGYAIFRYHGTQVDKITANANPNGEYMTVNAEKDTITAHLNRFSTYSIAYTEKYTVTFDANGGSVTPTSAKTNAKNKLDTLPTPTRNGSYSFDGWYTSAAGGTKVTTATVFASDSTIYAHWTYNGGSPTTNYTITATADAGGTISPAGNVTVGTGESKIFTITANPDYAISDVKVDGVSQGAVRTYTFTNVTTNHTIAATFTYTGGGTTIYTLTVVNGAGGGNYANGIKVSIVADEAPAGWRFKAWELTSGGGTLANANSASTTFTMPAGAATVTATYARLAGELAVSKTVTGGGNTNALFTFRFTFSEAGPYAYTGSKQGSIGNGGSIQLKHGESVTITIPQGVAYTVIEDAAAKYIPTPQSRTHTGTIAATPGTANFENRYDKDYVPPEPTLTGSLTVKKNVTGDLGDRNKQFAFIVTFNAAGYYSYISSKSGVIQSGDTVWLCHGESINILNLPAGTAYSVTERGNSGYRVYASGNTGVIVANGVSTAAFTNSRSSVPQTGEDNSLLGGVLMMVCAILGAAALLVLNGRIRRKRRGAGTIK